MRTHRSQKSLDQLPGAIGSTGVDEVRLRSMRAGDGPRLRHFHQTLSTRTTYMRFFSVHPELSDDEVYRFTHVDHHEREAIVAVAGRKIVGVARFDRLADGADGEVAFVVADAWQGRGIGTALFSALATRARQVGLRRLIADTLPHNTRMLAVFLHAGLRISTEREDDVIHVVLDL